ncbi:P-loop ATPase, Sll1717 family [Saccharothrix luteola]|uniref:P-loop ATPase, Sll1717 family n=1 Tax=Saccharothrix luteola TaxID=2893018 RepID=UPI001E387E94|nr:hypothetical protein [Saccharothrix luteola]MCC8248030.1 hypothetical protein [Saccharothrix luteola]
MTLDFGEEEIQKLFGHEAAEDETPQRLREYYFKSATYDQVATNLPLRVLVGHKGIGKSALFRVAVAENREKARLTVEIKPDDVADIAKGTNDFLTAIRVWKIGLREVIAKRAAQELGISTSLAVAEVRNAESTVSGLQAAIRMSPDSPISTQRNFSTEFMTTSQISVFIDDLDRGWEGRKADVHRISALLNAARDMVNDERDKLRFRISLRSDVYFLVRTSDESTDKIEGSVIWQSWTNHEIFALLVKRIETFFGRNPSYDRLRQSSQRELASSLNPVMDELFRGQGHWRNAPIHRVLMSLIRKRPRDLVKLCTLAARKAHVNGHSKIYTEDFQTIFEEYSQGRIQDTVNEFRSELPDIKRLILNMRPTVKEKTAKAGYVYTTADLYKKLDNIQEQGKFTFKTGRVATTKELAIFLYRINFLTGRRETTNGIVRKYFEEQRYLQDEFVDFGFDWEIHPAYRWALQPEDYDSIFDRLELSTLDEV